MDGYRCCACGKAGRAGNLDFWPRQRRPRLGVLGSRHRARALTCFARAKPDFLIIGAAKSGTTSLYEMVCRHPRVAPAVRKEVGYFDDARMHARGMLWYRHHFPTVLRKRGMLTGEATPSYLPHPMAPARAARAVPRAKLIAVLRNPVDRAYSQYNMRLRRGREYMSFEDAVRLEGERTSWDRERGARDPDHQTYSGIYHLYAGGGIYADHLGRWLEHFETGDILVASSEQMRLEQQKVLDSVFEFLGLESFGVSERVALNESPAPPMSPKTRKELVEFFRPHNARLYRMIGRRFDWDR